MNCCRFMACAVYYDMLDSFQLLPILQADLQLLHSLEDPADSNASARQGSFHSHLQMLKQQLELWVKVATMIARKQSHSLCLSMSRTSKYQPLSPMGLHLANILMPLPLLADQQSSSGSSRWALPRRSAPSH